MIRILKKIRHNIWIYASQHRLFLYFYYNIVFYRLCQRITIHNIRKKGFANIVFFAMNLPMWRYQHLYKLLSKDKRFNCIVIISVNEGYSETEAIIKEKQLIDYFESSNVKYVLLKDLDKKLVVKSLEPDILFYTQPYNQFGHNASYNYFKNKLLAYYPYGLAQYTQDWVYNTPFHNLGWRMYYPTKIHLENARKISVVRGQNVVVVGEPHADDFFSETKVNVWINAKNRKRIIWAPHFRIVENEMHNRASFMWTFDIMKKIAIDYSDKVYIIFKPHPRLYSELCEYKDWGAQKAEKYYDFWQNQENTHIEDGEYIDLFKTSDALIHDCCSFSAEYQYTKKPCMFLTKDKSAMYKDTCKFGRQCMDNHYFGSCEKDILNFIDNVVLLGNDLMKEQRVEFYNNYLIPPSRKTTAENTYDDIVMSIFGK